MVFECGCFEVHDGAIMLYRCGRGVPPIRGGVGYMDNGYKGETLGAWDS